LRDLGVDEHILSKWIFKETGYEDVDWIRLSQDYIVVASSCEYGNEYLGSIKKHEIS
jgi:hypothetical protein